MGKCKRSAARALEWLVDQGCEVAAVVAADPDEHTRPEQRPDLVAERHGLPLVSDDDLYAAIADPGSSSSTWRAWTWSSRSCSGSESASR